MRKRNKHIVFHFCFKKSLLINNKLFYPCMVSLFFNPPTWDLPGDSLSVMSLVWLVSYSPLEWNMLSTTCHTLYTVVAYTSKSSILFSVANSLILLPILQYIWLSKWIGSIRHDCALHHQTDWICVVVARLLVLQLYLYVCVMCIWLSTTTTVHS